MGGWCAVEFVETGEAKSQLPELAKAVEAGAAEKGVILLTWGVRGNVIRFLPQLTIADQLLGEALPAVGNILRDKAGTMRKAS